MLEVYKSVTRGLRSNYAPDLGDIVRQRFPGVDSIKRRVVSDILRLSDGGITRVGQYVKSKPYRSGEPLCFSSASMTGFVRIETPDQAALWTAATMRMDESVRAQLKKDPLHSLFVFGGENGDGISDVSDVRLMGNRPHSDWFISGLCELAVNPKNLKDLCDNGVRKSLLADTELLNCLCQVDCVRNEIERRGLYVDVWDVFLHGSYSKLFPGCQEAFAAARARLEKFMA